MFGTFFSLLVYSQPDPFSEQISLKGNDSELLDINGDGNSSVVSSARADWLVAVCHSNHGDMFNKMVIRLEKH